MDRERPATNVPFWTKGGRQCGIAARRQRAQMADRVSLRLAPSLCPRQPPAHACQEHDAHDNHEDGKCQNPAQDHDAQDLGQTKEVGTKEFH